VPLPELVSPELERLYQAIEADDPDTAEKVFPAVLAKVDTPQTRALIATAVTNLERGDRLDRRLAAAALIDLDSNSDLLISASLIPSWPSGRREHPAAYSSPRTEPRTRPLSAALRRCRISGGSS
jgi:hypothetical protein